ncbi:alanine dehydrogenase [Alicyclobacillus cycloheptanicus]|uniref:Alanine dehydrogenase n=1 Tax=Alicyclobacillus cycloheptanicus TaxID=1457 RepID=A0ABT9XJ69_9BACL|nr:alanine dehydrogenase [Alicyclobacillus cycloheptanicus]MDQ0190341.1 alanine dehydrogenase [Alicyclobacillus cycloheptanicus]WDM00019.1 alanine dehydrogenase [Alicyclobacillus cycloheptanicus]
MVIGVPKEIKHNEHRVAVTPIGVKSLIAHGHEVLVEAGAGAGCGFTDEEYQAAGAKLVSHEDAWTQASLVVKVKEPQASEYPFFREDLTLFTYLHLAAEPTLAKQLVASKTTAIGYETVQTPTGGLPLLAPMSEIAGRMAPQIAAQFLENHYGGRGILLGGVPGVKAANVVIVGGGTVGTNAAKIAVGMGAHVTILDKSAERLAYLDDLFGNKVQTLASNPYDLAACVADADVLIGAVLIPGAKAPKLVTTEMVQSMRPGSVIVDVAIDQGGSIETIDHVTTHEDPVYEKFGVLHYAVANIPGAAARTSTLALTNATLPFALAIANLGWQRAMQEQPVLRGGLNTAEGKITHPTVARALDMAYEAYDAVLS